MSFRRSAAPLGTLVTAIAGFIVIWSSVTAGPSAAAGAPQVSGDLHDLARRRGSVRVIVELKLPSTPIAEGVFRNPAAVLGQRQNIAAAAAELLSRLPTASHRVLHEYQTAPYLALEVNSEALGALDSLNSNVARVIPDTIIRPSLADSVPLIQGDQAWAAGYDGTGTAIAVLDTGVDSTHPFLAGKVVAEACYSSTVAGTSETFCPNGLDIQIGPGAAAPCPLSDCFHGTHVAGIAAGNGAAAGQPFSGVAKGAHLIAIQVFSRITDPASCGGVAPCVGGFTSDVIAGLERVYALAQQYNVASVNLSLGSDLFAAPCDNEPYKPIIDNLRSVGIATVAASGNGYTGSAIMSPACISSAVSVGSTTKNDDVSWFSNIAPFLSLLAPGDGIESSILGGTYAAESGTSMATPHVAGAWAVAKQALPTASVTTLLDAFQQTGKPISDTRLFFGLGTVVPRINLFEALASLVSIPNPEPSITALAPTHAKAGGTPLSLIITGSGFNAFSVAQWNGVPKPTTVINTTTLSATIPLADLMQAGAAQVAVFTAAPGGGTSSSLTFTVEPPATLTPSVTSVAPGAQLTVTLANGFGGASDWLALASAGAADASYLQWTYVGGGLTSKTWTLTMPTTAGTYEFRLFLNNGFTRAATSPPVTVDTSLTPAPVATSLSPNSALAGGTAFTLTVNGNSFAPTSVVKWNGSNRSTTFVSSTQLQAAIGAADIAGSGTAQVTVVTPPPGGGTSVALPFTISGPPVLTVSATNVAAGADVTATLTNGPGGAGDWLALAPTNAPNTSYLQYVYVGGGVTTRTWTVAMPTTGGTYEFRLFLNNGYTPAATSPTITVVSNNPVPSIGSLSPSTAAVGSAAFTLSVNGSGFVNTSTIRWNGAVRPTTFVNSTLLQAAIPASDLTTVGTAQIAVFSPTPGGGTSAALPFTIASGLPGLTVSATNVGGGANVTVTLVNGAGGASDWLALAATTAPNTSYLQYTYVGAGVTTRTWTVAMPQTGGSYEFRLFLNNGYTRAATSPAVTVAPGPNAVPVLSSLTPSSVLAGTSSLTLSVNGTGFVSSSVVRWNGANRPTTFVSATQLQAAISAADLAAVGSAQVSVFSPSPGGGTSNPLTFSVTVAPVLTVNTTTVMPGGQVTVTLTGGFGGGADWLAFAPTSVPNTSYLQYIYVGAGVTTRSWTVTAPSTVGPYEFRLFLNNGYTRAATSPTVAVVAP
jgi:subtilisin family serine protease